MSVTVTTAAADLTTTRSKKLVVTTSDNSRIFIIVPKDSTHFTIWEGSLDRATWTLKGTYTTTALLSSYRFNAEIGHDDSYIVVSYVCDSAPDHEIRMKIVSTSTWVNPSEILARPDFTGVSLYNHDISVSETGAILVCCAYIASGGKIGYTINIRDTSGVWTQPASVNLNPTTSSLKTSVLDISCSWHKGVSSSIRRFTILPSFGTVSKDYGVRYIHCSINEDTGASFSRNDRGFMPQTVLNITYTSGTSFAAQPRKAFLWAVNSGEQIMGCLIANAGGIEGKTTFFKILTTGANAAADVVDYGILTSKINGNVYYNNCGNCSSATYSLDINSLHIVNYLSPTNYYSDSKGRIVTGVQQIRGFLVSGVLNVLGEFNQGEDWEYPDLAPTAIFPSSSRSRTNKLHDVMWFVKSGATNTVKSSSVKVNIPSTLKPAGGELVTSSKPLLTVSAFNRPWQKNAPTLTPEFKVAKDASFTLSVQDVYGNDTKMAPYSVGSTTPIGKLWSAVPLSSGNWYLQGRLLDIYGNYSSWVSLASPFSISHPGYALVKSHAYDPNGDPNPTPWNDPSSIGYMQVPIEWYFLDAWASDYQSAYQITAYDMNLANALIYDSGKVISSSKSSYVQVPLANKGDGILFAVQLWDRYDESYSIYAIPSSFGSFVTYDAAQVINIALVTVDAGFCNSTSPVFSYEIVPSIYNTAYMDIKITTGSTTVYTGTISNPALIGEFATNQSVLVNDTDYTATFYATDERGMTKPYTFQFHTQWSPPDAPVGVTVSTTDYNIEDKGGVVVSWNGTVSDPDFFSWKIYRKVNQIDMNGSVLSYGELEFLYEDMALVDNPKYIDYFAPSGSQVGYVVRQVINFSGSIIESINTAPKYVNPQSSGYWLIDPTPESGTYSAFKLSIVTDDSYTNEYEEQEIHIIGLGRHIDRGDNMGVRGSLTCQLRDSPLKTARQKKLRLEQIKKEVRSLFLRTPFGDTWYVNVGDMQITRIAGVGLSEFVNVTIPYAEVYNV